ncbi:hypothetical protein L1987_21128 [Smallanthus sonchifolius]|uniref:Uncharacterized protein n=1 Tax=Smallanthus sonchifolius TaxID=185202 RepID=A0ACB9IV95_9ASTR|nr:hypothetical protein L1987_21128 [Smallanthus sonchifolius]
MKATGGRSERGSQEADWRWWVTSWWCEQWWWPAEFGGGGLIDQGERKPRLTHLYVMIQVEINHQQDLDVFLLVDLGGSDEGPVMGLEEDYPQNQNSNVNSPHDSSIILVTQEQDDNSNQIMLADQHVDKDDIDNHTPSKNNNGNNSDIYLTGVQHKGLFCSQLIPILLRLTPSSAAFFSQEFFSDSTRILCN